MMQKPNFITHHISGAAPGDAALLARAYDDLYVPLFPMPEEREPLDAWLDGITRPDPDIAISARVITAGNTPSDDVIAGFGIAKYFPVPDVGFVSCIAVAPTFRSCGLGRALLGGLAKDIATQARFEDKPLQGVFFETNNPKKVSPEEDSMDPAKRLEIYQHWGCQVIDIDYVQPPIEPGGSFCDKLLLMAHPHPVHGAMPSAKAVQGLVDIIYADPLWTPQKDILYQQVDVWRCKKELAAQNIRAARPELC